MLIVGFLVLVLALAVVGFILNRRSVNIAFLSIGIDYFQVLAMFSRSNIKWPSGERVERHLRSERCVLRSRDVHAFVFVCAELSQFFAYMSIFNFNIDITAPEVRESSVGVCLTVAVRVLSFPAVSRCLFFLRAVCHAGLRLQDEVDIRGGFTSVSDGASTGDARDACVQEACSVWSQGEDQLACSGDCRHFADDDVLPVSEPNALRSGHLQLPGDDPV